MTRFNLVISAVAKIVYSGAAEYCGVTTLSGSIGFKANHEAFTGVLQPDSEVEYIDKNGDSKKVAVLDGIISFKNNSCTVTVSLSDGA